MAQHVTTLNEIREGMDPTDTPSNTDLIYAERGSGSDRARSFQVDEIAAKATESLGNDGDIAFSQYQAAGGVTRTKGEIQDGKILGRMFASIVNLITKVLCWYNQGFGTTEIGYDGLKFWNSEYNPSDPSGVPDYRFDKEGNAKVGQLVLALRSFQQAADTRYAKMTDCEATTAIASRKFITEYLTKVDTNRPDFWLDSKVHEAGSVVMVTNTGEGDIYCIPAWYDNTMGTYEQNALATITPYNSKCFVFRRMQTINNVEYPVWTAL